MSIPQPITIYTDGACDPNPGKGGWAAVILENGQQRTLSGSEPNSTNNRMELTAAIEGLKAVQASAPVVLYCDSEYVKKGITEWIIAWKKKGWRRPGGVLANIDLWQELDRQNTSHRVTWQWVHGHAGHPMNELADRLAVQARKSLKPGISRK
jgi:ribonuclease HI